jgi:threonine/homoserine/homoserine lactone efflux protein
MGFAIAAPVGPIGVLCIRRTLAHGRLTGLVSGLGAASADALYGSLAAFGLTALSRLLLGQQRWLAVVGGIFLVYLGVRTLLAPLAKDTEAVQGLGLVSAYASTFLLTLTNPMTILSFAAVFAGLGAATSSGTFVPAALLVAGVLLGSALWWFTLSGAVSFLSSRLEPVHLRWINRTAGLVILAFGVVALLRIPVPPPR